MKYGALKISFFLIVLMGLIIVSGLSLSVLAASLPGNGVNLNCGVVGMNGAPSSDPCLTATDADTDWRYVGITSTNACPTPSNWDTRKLFRLSQADIPPGLNKFCVFQTDDEFPNTGQLAAQLCTAPDPPSDCLSKLDPDSVSMAMMGSNMADLMWEPLREQFLNQIGKVGALPAAPQNTRLAIIDTEPSGFGEDQNGAGISQHGFTLINLIRDMICPFNTQCAVQLKSGLGLPLQRCASSTGYCRDPLVGGYAGTISDLALAIRTEVAEWETSGVENLAINLSVAWDPLFSTGNPIGTSRVAAQAVYQALQDASCRGALVIAAAGNRVTGPSANLNPLLPAGWESVNAPSMTECAPLLGGPPDPSHFSGVYHPLIYAVGAVHADNTPAETRLQGEPRLTAFGDHAVSAFDELTTATPTQILTGTSVSAAVVSAAAAAAWHFAGGKTAHEIMDSVYDSGTDLGRLAEFCVGGPPCTFDVRRVSVCQAVDEVCSGLPAGSCPVFTCTPFNTVLPALPETAIESEFTGVNNQDVTTLTAQTSYNQCRPGYVLHHAPGAVIDNPCPHLQYFSVQATPWTDGQPEGQYCPTCTDTFHSPGVLYLEIDSGMEGTLRDITLLCKDDAFRLSGELVAGDKLVISEIPENCEFEEVAVAFRLDNGTGSLVSSASPALLIPDRDDDGIQDGLDNCLEYPNPNQIDADGDGIGNFCDGDTTNDCQTNFSDYAQMTALFLSSDPVADLNSSGTVNFGDYSRFAEMFLQLPGPSGVNNICQP